jgi:digeranylgeranylglycerophospholipid reductase
MIAIIGAGPVGCYAASLLADKFRVVVFEEHKNVGLPIQCTGIVTQEIFNFIPKKNNFMINQVSGVRIFAPNNKFIKLKLDKPDIIVDRQKFDSYFYNLARKKGVEFFFSHKFMSIQGNSILVKNLASGRIKKFKFSYLVGADGPLSPVAKSIGLFAGRKFFTGIQAVVKKNNSNVIDFYPFKGGFGWAVPEDKNTLRIGVASISNPKEQFEKLLGKYNGKVIAKQGGLVPIFKPSASFSKENIFLIGDAAGFVKATTGGGLVPGLRSAEIVAHTINNNVSYTTGLYLNLVPNLWLNLKMRNMMDSFTPDDWNELIKDLNNNESKKALQAINRDQLFKLLLSMAAKNPRIMKHGLKHITGLF